MRHLDDLAVRFTFERARAMVADCSWGFEVPTCLPDTGHWPYQLDSNGSIRTICAPSLKREVVFVVVVVVGVRTKTIAAMCHAEQVQVRRLDANTV